MIGGRQTLSLFLAALLVVSSVPMGPVGTAAAQEEPGIGICFEENLDWLISFAIPSKDSGERCTYRSKAIEDMEELDGNQTKSDIYSAAAGAKADRETWLAPYDNYLNDTESVAWMKAEAAIAESYQNGETQAEARIAARDAIADYYATKQVNLIERYNVTVQEGTSLADTARMEEAIARNYVEARYVSNDLNDAWGATWAGSLNTSQTLVNGSSHGSMAIKAQTTNIEHGTDDGYTSVEVTHTGTFGATNWEGDAFIVHPPNDNHEEMVFLKPDKFGKRWERIETMNSRLQAESDNYVNGTWPDYESGAINASDVVSSHTAMFEYGVRSGNESEGLYRSTAALAMMGFDTPDLNTSGTMSVTYRNQEYTGLLLAKNAPNGSWEADTSYNTADIEGPVFMATTDGQKVDFAEGESFRVGEMKAKDGTQVNSTQTTKYVYKTANTSELLEMQKQMQELRQEIEDREAKAGTGGGSDGGGDGDGPGVQTLAFGALAIFVVTAILFRG